MKNKKMIALLLVLVLMMSGCAQGIADETTAPDPVKQTEITAQQAETTAPSVELVVFPAAPDEPEEKPLAEHSQAVTDYWSQGLHFGDKNTAFTYYISIPEIYPFSTDAVACQKEIYELYKNRLYEDLTALETQHKGNIQQLEVPEGLFLDDTVKRTYAYTAGVYGDVLSIAIRFDVEETENSNYYVYYLDLTTGKRLTDLQAQEKYSWNITDIKNAVADFYRNLYNAFPQTYDWHQAQMDKTLSDDSIKDCQVFCTEEGKLMLVARIYTAGSVETVEKLISLPQ